MKTAMVILFAVMLAGCTSTKQLDNTVTPPVLLEQTTLPSLPMKAYFSNIVLNMRIFIDEEGSVKYVKFISGSGDKNWDSAACETVMNWRFAPATAGGKPVKIWVNQSAIIRPADPLYLTLAEIVCRNAEHADSVMKALSSGSDFYELASRCSCAPSKIQHGRLGSVDINKYSGEIFYTLRNTHPNDYTQPLKYGSRYIIFKREAE